MNFKNTFLYKLSLAFVFLLISATGNTEPCELLYQFTPDFVARLLSPEATRAKPPKNLGQMEFILRDQNRNAPSGRNAKYYRDAQGQTWQVFLRSDMEARHVTAQLLIGAALSEKLGLRSTEPVLVRQGNDSEIDYVIQKRVNVNRGNSTINSDDFAQLFFVSAFLGAELGTQLFSDGTVQVTDFGSSLGLSKEYQIYSLGGFGLNKAGLDAAMNSAMGHADFLGIDHPWSKLTTSDMLTFKGRLMGLTNLDIQAIVSRAQLPKGSAEFMNHALKTRRDLFLDELESWFEKRQTGLAAQKNLVSPELKRKLAEPNPYWPSQSQEFRDYVASWTPKLLSEARDVFGSFSNRYFDDLSLLKKVVKVFANLPDSEDRAFQHYPAAFKRLVDITQVHVEAAPSAEISQEYLFFTILNNAEIAPEALKSFTRMLSRLNPAVLSNSFTSIFFDSIRPSENLSNFIEPLFQNFLQVKLENNYAVTDRMYKAMAELLVTRIEGNPHETELETLLSNLITLTNVYNKALKVNSATSQVGDLDVIEQALLNTKKLFLNKPFSSGGTIAQSLKNTALFSLYSR